MISDIIQDEGPRGRNRGCFQSHTASSITVHTVKPKARLSHPCPVLDSSILIGMPSHRSGLLEGRRSSTRRTVVPTASPLFEKQKANADPARSMEIVLVEVRGNNVAYGRVEDGRGSLGPMANAPFPIPRLIKPDEPISGIRLFPTGFTAKAHDGTARGRRWRHRTPSSSMNDIECESAITAPLAPCAFRARNLRTTFQRHIGRRYGMALAREPVAKSSWTSLAETCSACHNTSGHGSILLGTRRSPILVLRPLHTLLGRARTQIPIPVRLKTDARPNE